MEFFGLGSQQQQGGWQHEHYLIIMTQISTATQLPHTVGQQSAFILTLATNTHTHTHTHAHAHTHTHTHQQDKDDCEKTGSVETKSGFKDGED